MENKFNFIFSKHMHSHIHANLNVICCYLNTRGLHQHTELLPAKPDLPTEGKAVWVTEGKRGVLQTPSSKSWHSSQQLRCSSTFLNSQPHGASVRQGVNVYGCKAILKPASLQGRRKYISFELFTQSNIRGRSRIAGFQVSSISPFSIWRVQDCGEEPISSARKPNWG